MERRVIHLNIADFSVAVERLLDRTLRVKPLIIAPAASRAVVYDMSEEAYRDGVRKGMRLSVARARCRQALVLPPRPAQYQKALAGCMRHALQFTPLVEQSSGNGHLYLDVTGTHRLFGPAPDIGWRLRNTLRRDLGLDPIWSVGPNKLVAKVASRLVKPLGEYIVAEGEEVAFLAPLPLTLLPGLAGEDLSRFGEMNIRRVHQAAALSVQELGILCSQRARSIYQAVRGIDPSPVHPGGPTGGDRAYRHLFSPDTNEDVQVRASLADLVRQAGYGLRQQQLGCRRVTVHLTYTDGIGATRQASAPLPVADDRALGILATTALSCAWRRRVRLRQLTLACSLLSPPAEQLSLFGRAETAARRKNNNISKACDIIAQRCGGDKIRRGRSLLPPTATSAPDR